MHLGNRNHLNSTFKAWWNGWNKQQNNNVLSILLYQHVNKSFCQKWLWMSKASHLFVHFNNNVRFHLAITYYLLIKRTNKFCVVFPISRFIFISEYWKIQQVNLSVKRPYVHNFWQSRLHWIIKTFLFPILKLINIEKLSKHSCTWGYFF